MSWAREGVVWQSPLTVPFRGLTRRSGMLLRGPAGWGGFAPFWDYDDAAATRWLASAREAANLGWPEPVRCAVAVNLIVPAVGPERARALVLAGGGCRTAKVKVAQVSAPAPGGEQARAGEPRLESLGQEVARVAAVRSALDELHGPGVGRIRLDANGAWTPAQAVEHLRELDRVAGGLEYIEQPCATVAELAEVRQELRSRRVGVLVAADESIRRAEDPLRVRDLGAADVVVLKVAPLGGVRACLRLAEQLALPVVVSSALDSSIGLAGGLALAGALPELPFACGLATAPLLARDVVAEPLLPVDGALPVLRADDERLRPAGYQPADPGTAARWRRRLERVSQIAR